MFEEPKYPLMTAGHIRSQYRSTKEWPKKIVSFFFSCSKLKFAAALKMQYYDLFISLYHSGDLFGNKFCGLAVGLVNFFRLTNLCNYIIIIT
jgi:hypothetical protein